MVARVFEERERERSLRERMKMVKMSGFWASIESKEAMMEIPPSPLI